GDPDTIADLNRIHSAGKHLLKLVNEVLDLIKIDAGKMSLYREKVDFADLIEEIVAGVKANNSNSLSEIHTNCSDNLGGLITDRTRLYDAIFELVENAVKFTKDGRVDIEARRVSDGMGPGNDALLIKISDTGVGIPAEHLPTLFEQFSMFNDASSSKYGGTGLGLALTQRICRLLGGDIDVTSEENKGSCFTVTIPFALAEGEVLPEEAAVDAAGDGTVAMAEVEQAISLLKAAAQENRIEDKQTVKVAVNG
ncbi:MAG: hypothetical protein KDJ29_05770, partial [Hyphomicrobiales bacterium]|nr:hypothetical protein [Hyphomicrobiales bacterium]